MYGDGSWLLIILNINIIGKPENGDKKIRVTDVRTNRLVTFLSQRFGKRFILETMD
jgi:hypothetical protein